MHRDLIELLSALNSHRVKYLVVGGYAVSFHAQPRATKDVDVFVHASAENAQRLYAALAQFGAPLQQFTPADFAERGPFFRMGREPVAVDILTDIPGVEFDSAWEGRTEGVVDKNSDVRVYFISRDDLIAAKIAAGRPQDLADVAAIRKAAAAAKKR